MSVLKKIFQAIITIAVAVVATVLFGPVVGVFLGLAIGAIIGFALFGSKSSATQEKINVRIAEAPRFFHAGKCKTGGATVFAEFASNADLWYIVVHGDAPIDSIAGYYLDDLPVTVDGSGAVQSKAFRLNDNNEAVTYDGAGNTHIWLYTATHTMSNPVPPFPSAAFRSYFAQWTDDHLLVGTTYTVVRCLGMKTEGRYKWYKWRGPLGLGEPNVAIVGNYNFCYDPRDNTQVLGDPTTYKFTRNSALVWARFRTHRYGRNKPESSINWTRVGEMADICDQTVVGAYGSHTRYRCDVSIPEDQERGEAEASILATMDGQIVFDSDGRYWSRCGYYYTPTVSLSRNRDILAMESLEALDGESETQGVIVRYSDPDAAYALQPSAAWYNPNYYIAGTAATFLTIDIPAIQDHNQAMRIAKAIGMRNQPLQKLAPTTLLRGLACMHERIINLDYDNAFAGDYEVASQVEIDAAGATCQVGLVPVDVNRWTLLAGEEKPKPVVNSSGSAALVVELPTGLVFTQIDNTIQVQFDPPDAYGKAYEFQYIRVSDYASGLWIYMTVDMYNYFAISGVVADGIEYYIRYRSRIGGITVSDWSSLVTFTTATPISAPTGLTGVAAGSGVATIGWRNPTSAAFSYIDLWMGTSTSFGSASKVVGNIPGGLGEVMSYNYTTTTGTKYFWVVARTADGTSSTPTGPVSVTVT